MQVNQIKQFKFHFIWAMQCICTQSDNAIQSNINMSIETQFNSEYKISNKSRNPAPDFEERIAFLWFGRLERSRKVLLDRVYTYFTCMPGLIRLYYQT